jgi:hypothetical protein
MPLRRVSLRPSGQAGRANETGSFGAAVTPTAQATPSDSFSQAGASHDGLRRRRGLLSLCAHTAVEQSAANIAGGQHHRWKEWAVYYYRHTVVAWVGLEFSTVVAWVGLESQALLASRMKHSERPAGSIASEPVEP